LWIRIQILNCIVSGLNDFVDPESAGKKIKKNMHFLVHLAIFLNLKVQNSKN
jgi:hypothetical protein